MPRFRKSLIRLRKMVFFCGANLFFNHSYNQEVSHTLTDCTATRRTRKAQPLFSKEPLINGLSMVRWRRTTDAVGFAHSGESAIPPSACRLPRFAIAILSKRLARTRGTPAKARKTCMDAAKQGRGSIFLLEAMEFMLNMKKRSVRRFNRPDALRF